tara:strand:- start:86 stop:430 length:345 start_codon:yes stop_codon:yes gene_type:complete
MNFKFVYKICTKTELIEAKQKGKFIGTKKDLEDGYIHFSDKEQVLNTLNKYFNKKKDLVLLKIETSKLDSLVWEQGSDGNMFPHFYSTLDVSNICGEYYIDLNDNSSFILPLDF